MWDPESELREGLQERMRLSLVDQVLIWEVIDGRVRVKCMEMTSCGFD